MSFRVFILVLNYKRFQDTKSCIESLNKSNLPKNTKIVVIDNSPNNESVQILSKEFPETKIIKNKSNLGFAGGNNVGIKYALKNKATHILILNPDTTHPKNFLKKLLDNSTKYSADIIAPALKHIQNKKTFFGLEGSVNWKTSKATHLNVKKVQNPNPRTSEFVTFACALITRKVFKEVGLLNTDYFMYLEDVDYCLKANKKGFKIILDPSVVVNHSTSSSFKKPTDKLLISFKSQLRFIRNWIPFPQNIYAFLYNLIFYPYLYLLWTYHSLKHKN